MLNQAILIFVVLILVVSSVPSPTPSSPPTTCEVIQKSRPFIISKGTENDLLLSTYHTEVGTEVVVTCLFDGYVVKGANKLTCLQTGKWSSAIPTCSAPEKKTLIDLKLILGLSLGGACTIIIIIIVAVVLRQRKVRKTSQPNSNNRHIDGRDNPGYMSGEELKTRYIYSEQDTSLNNSPHVYKVWSRDRKTKKFVAAYNFAELVTKAGKTFNIPDPMIVLEEDGTEIEDTTALTACQDKTLQVMSRKSTWCRRSRGSLESDAGYLSSNISVESDGVIDLRGDHPSEFGTLRSYHL